MSASHCDICGTEWRFHYTICAPESSAAVAQDMCYVVHKNINYEHEVIGIYDSLKQARAQCAKEGIWAWITEHKMNAPGIGIHISHES